MTLFQRFLLAILISLLMPACSVEVKPLPVEVKPLDETGRAEPSKEPTTSENPPAQDLKESTVSENSPAKNSGEETTVVETPPADETNKEKCDSGNLVDDIGCDVDKMEM